MKYLAPLALLITTHFITESQAVTWQCPTAKSVNEALKKGETLVPNNDGGNWGFSGMRTQESPVGEYRYMQATAGRRGMATCTYDRAELWIRIDGDNCQLQGPWVPNRIFKRCGGNDCSIHCIDVLEK